MNSKVWDLPYFCINSHRVFSPASSSGVHACSCLQPSPRGRGEGDSQTLEAPLWKFHPPLATALGGLRDPAAVPYPFLVGTSLTLLVERH